MTVEELGLVFANGTADEKLRAVLLLPDETVAASALLEGQLNSADPRLRIAILDALYRINQDPQVKAELITILDSTEAEGDLGEQIYMMARISLNRIESDVDDVISGEEFGFEVMGAAVATRPDRLAIIIHGTWARNGVWWRTGGDFHTYLLSERNLDYLYKDNDPFVWSGRNRDADRQDAAQALKNWVQDFDPKKLDVYAHSHGANVAMLATKNWGLKIQKLVMMSPPVRSDYFADWGNVESAYNIQASFDPVVSIARGGQWFHNGIVLEKVIPSNSHSASHDPEAWRANGLDTMVGI